VGKEETRIAGTQFTLGSKPIKRGDPKDWEKIRELAIGGQLLDIPADVFVRYYGNLKSIQRDNFKVDSIERKVVCYWGPSGVGKSRRSRYECKGEVYSKDPTSKWWDLYHGQPCVIIDEYDGGFPISSLLRWTDRYPVSVEVKSGVFPLNADQIFITCNMNPYEWYPNIKPAHWAALTRRIEIVYMGDSWVPPSSESVSDS